jgi:hypothetical protein
MAWDIKNLPFVDFSAAAAEWIQNNPIECRYADELRLAE